MQNSNNFQFQLFSDVHLECSKNDDFYPVPKAKYLILAGDIGNISKSNYKQFFDYCSNNWTKTYYVAGNHEYHYKRTMSTINEKMHELFSTYHNVIFLNNTFDFVKETRTVIYGFVGWTYPIFSDYHEASRHLNDYKRINTLGGKFNISFHSELAHDGIQQFKSFIELSNENPKIEHIIVITHFPPINMPDYQTSNPVYGEDELKDYYTWRNLLEMENIDGKKIKLWCSGHTHWKYDFVNGSIRYVSNPVGHKDEEFELNDEPYEIDFDEINNIWLDI